MTPEQQEARVSEALRRHTDRVKAINVNLNARQRMVGGHEMDRAARTARKSLADIAREEMERADRDLDADLRAIFGEETRS